MEVLKCPKCSGDVARHWINKRKQHVGKCKACGKLVYFGKAEKDNEPYAGSEKDPAKKTPAAQTGQHKTAPPARGAGKRSTGTGKAGKRPFRAGGCVPDASAGAGTEPPSFREWFAKFFEL